MQCHVQLLQGERDLRSYAAVLSSWLQSLRTSPTVRQHFASTASATLVLRTCCVRLFARARWHPCWRSSTCSTLRQTPDMQQPCICVVAAGCPCWSNAAELLILPALT